MSLLNKLSKFFQVNHHDHPISESAIRYTDKQEKYIKIVTTPTLNPMAGFDQHFEKRLSEYADHHPALLVRQLAIRLRDIKCELADKQKCIDAANDEINLTLIKQRSEIEELTQKLATANETISNLMGAEHDR